LLNHWDCPEFDKPARWVMCAMINSSFFMLMLFSSKYVCVLLECMCFEILCYSWNILLFIMCHQIFRDGAISFLYTELQRYNQNDEIWRLYRSNYIIITSFFLWILYEASNCLDVDFSFLSNTYENSIHTSS
jgi:hypothetical protein